MTSMSQPLASSPSSRRKSVLFHWASTISLGWGCRSRTKKTGPEGCCSRPSPRSTKVKFGARVLDGAFRAMCTRLAADNNPNLLLLNYDLRGRGHDGYLRQEGLPCPPPRQRGGRGDTQGAPPSESLNRHLLRVERWPGEGRGDTPRDSSCGRRTGP